MACCDQRFFYDRMSLSFSVEIFKANKFIAYLIDLFCSLYLCRIVNSYFEIVKESLYRFISDLFLEGYFSNVKR